MRVLYLTEGTYHLDTPIAPILEGMGVSIRVLPIQELRGVGSRNRTMNKVHRYLPSASMVRSIKRAIEDFSPDIIHIGQGRTVALPVMLALRGMPEMPVVFSHGAIEGLNLLSPFDWMTYFNRRITRLLVPSKAHVNNWMGRPLLRRAIGSGRCDVLPHAIAPSPDLGETERAVLRARYGFAADEIVVGTVCWIRPIKNLAFVADVVRRLGPPFVFAVVGSGSETELERIRQAGGDRLRLLGKIPGARDMMAAFDIFVTPSRLPGESFGLAPAEAMAAGVPVLTMNFGGTAEIIEQGVSGFGLPYDPDAWSGALKLLAGDVERRKAMGLAARERIATSFSPEAIGLNCYHLYANLLRSGAPGFVDRLLVAPVASRQPKSRR